MSEISKTMIEEPSADRPEQQLSTTDVVIDVRDVTKSYDMWATPSARLTAPIMRRVASLPIGMNLKQRLLDKADSQHRVFQALHKTNLQIRRGESWGIIGVNGSGKSTLLKMVSGSLRPTTGRIEVDGKVAILDFSSGLNPEFTGRENVFLKAAMFGMPRKVVEQRYDDIAAFADIGDFINLPVKTYSSGMMARLGFAILAHVDADILITDEALAVGDAFFVQKCMRWIRDFIARGTFIMVSHSINDIMSLCNKAVWLENGEIRNIGSAKDVAEAYMASSMVRRSERFKVLSQSEATEEIAEKVAIEDAVNSKRQSEPTSAGVALSALEISKLATSKPARVIKDPRLEWINRSQWRNDIEVIPFDTGQTGIGTGGARIDEVYFATLDGDELQWIIGGEMVRITAAITIETEVAEPIVGFLLRDRLGQALFGDNTFLATVEQSVGAPSGSKLTAQFEFQMPLLPSGEYVVGVGIADGASESENNMLHFLDNALVIRSNTPGPRHGLVGVPMHAIRIMMQNENQPG